MSKQKELNQMVAEYEKQVQKLEDKLVKFALEHDLDLTLGDYGAGRSLLTAKDFEGGNPDADPNDPEFLGSHWSGKSIGEWVYSSEGC